MLANQEMNSKDIEIATLKAHNEQLQNELKVEKDFIQRMNKSNEAVKFFEDYLRSPRGIHDTTGLGYISTTKKGESSSSGEQKKTKGKPFCHHCVKWGHIINVHTRKNIK